MEKNLPRRLHEVLFGTADKAESKKLANLQKQGLIRKIAPRLYSSNLNDAPKEIIRRNWLQILSKRYPEALLSHRSALEFKPTPTGDLFITYSYTKKIKLPGLTIHLIKGPKKTENDAVFFGNLFVSHEARAFLENLLQTRKPEKLSKTLSQKEIEEKLELILKIRDEKSLNQLRDKARLTSKELKMPKEFKKLDKLISALLSAHPSKILTSDAAKVRAFGEPIDINRIKLFEKLYDALADKLFSDYMDKNTAPKSYRNFGFFESYFSNYIEGTRFEVEEAKQIIDTQTPLPTRDEDSHDVLGTYNIVSNRKEMSVCPTDANHFLDLLKYRHSVILSARPSKNPGLFKDKNNFAGSTAFTDFKEVKGTLKKAFDYYAALRHPFAKAVYMMFIVSEVHPFLDGNGRMARLMMNAELTAANHSKIIIPTVFRDDYMGALRKLTRQGDAETYIRMMQRAHMFSANIYGQNADAMETYLKSCNAFKEPDEARLKIMVNDND